MESSFMEGLVDATCTTFVEPVNTIEAPTIATDEGA
jgi:hypothetical protein